MNLEDLEKKEQRFELTLKTNEPAPRLSESKIRKALRAIRKAEERSHSSDREALGRLFGLSGRAKSAHYRHADALTRLALHCTALEEHAKGASERVYAFTFNIGTTLPGRVLRSERGAAAEVSRMLNELSKRVLGRKLEYILNLEVNDSGMFHFHALISLKDDELRELRRALSGTPFGKWQRGRRYRVHAIPATAPISWIFYGSKDVAKTRSFLRERGAIRVGTFAVSRSLVRKAPELYQLFKMKESTNGSIKGIN